MMEMWNTYGTVQRVLFAMAVPSTLLLVVELVLLLVGLSHGPGDADMDAGDAPDADASGLDMPDADAPDMDAPGDMDSADMPDADAPDEPDAHAGHGEPGDLRWFTLVGVLALLAITGWAGLALIDAELQTVVALMVALGLGVLAMYLCALVMRRFSRLGASGNIALGNAVGRFADAYQPILPGRAPGGKVTLTLQGRFIELDAVTDDAQPIATGSRVVITGLADGDTVLVRAARNQTDD